jgi:hypothetical protein
VDAARPAALLFRPPAGVREDFDATAEASAGTLFVDEKFSPDVALKGLDVDVANWRRPHEVLFLFI